MSQALLAITYFQGGSTYNIIPETVVIKGTVRTYEEELDRFIAQRIDEITAGICKAMKAEYDFQFKVGYPPLINDRVVTEEIIRSAMRILGKENVINNQVMSMGGEDFSYFTKEVSGALFEIGSGTDVDHPKILHNNQFDIDESCLMTGMLVMSQWIMDRLNKPLNTTTP